MVDFFGRERELEVLDQALTAARTGSGIEYDRCLMIRGRRRIGKSALVETFIRRSGVPSVYFTATGMGADAELAAFAQAVADSDLPDRDRYREIAPAGWPGALHSLAAVLPADQPSIVVLDEVPFLMESVDAFEGILQRDWDRQLSRKPVVLVLVGSDLSMMEALNTYERPFYQRGQEMIVRELTPADIADMLSLDPADAFDAALVTGGLPLVCSQWKHGQGLWDFLDGSLANPVSALLVSAERTLAAEFPSETQARTVLGAIGTGERSHANIARAAGGMATGNLNRALEPLIAKRIVAAEAPLSTRPSRETRYRITDSYLRFWFRFLQPNMSEIERMRGDKTLARIKNSWPDWRGRAIEPLVREALWRLLPDDKLPDADVNAVGGYWTRSNDVEIDLVGADRKPIAEKLYFIGSIKWLNTPFDIHDRDKLVKARDALTGDPLPLVAVSRSGVTCPIDAAYGPEDLLQAWRQRPPG